MRPALTRAIAAHGSEPRARAALVPLVARGDNYFRGAVIEALGDYNGNYALAEITEVAKLDGRCRTTRFTALGKIGDASTVGVAREPAEDRARANCSRPSSRRCVCSKQGVRSRRRVLPEDA